MSILSKYKFQLYLLFLVLICYWPFTFFVNALSNDNIDVALATKYFAGTCLQNGELPLWNPYQIFGFPAHADLQYTNWSIEVLFIGILKGYDYYTLHILYLLYLYIGVLGMFLLAKFLSKNSLISFYVASIYILSGLFTAHSQSLVTILGLVWMPFVLLSYLKWLGHPSLKTSISIAIFSYLAFTLGYQAIAFVLIPIIVGLLLLKIYDALKNNTLQLIKHYVIWGIVTCLFLGVLLSPVLITQIQSKLFVERLNGLSLEEAMANPFPPYGLISIINPILTIGNDDLFNTDVTMRNIYMGIIPVILFMISLFKKNKTKVEYLLLFFGILFLLASFGDYTPVRKILYYTFPGFKLFRFPSLIRLVAITSFIMYLIVNFKFAINTFFQNKKIRNLLLVTFTGISLILTFISFIKCPSFTFFTIENTFNQRVMKSSPYEIAFYYGIFQSSLLLTCLLLFNQARSFKLFSKRLFVCTIIELSFTIIVYGQYVAFSNTKPSEIQKNFSKLTDHFTEPSKDPQILNTVKFDYLSVFWKNTGCFKKQAMPYDEWTSYLFKNYNQLQDHYPNLKDSLYNYPFLYFSKPLKHEKEITDIIDTTLSSIQNTFHHQDANVKYNYLSYSPHHIKVKYNSKDDCILNLQQTYYKGWKVCIDENMAPLIWNSSLLMSVAIPKGEHYVEFTYSNPTFNKSLIFSYCLLFLLVATLILLININIPYKIIFILLLALFISKTYIYFNHSKDSTNSKQQFSFSNKSSFELPMNNREDYRNLWDYCKKHKSETLLYKWENYYNSPEFLHSLNSNPEEYGSNKLTGYIFSRINDGVTNSLLFAEVFDKSYNEQQFIDTLHSSYSIKLESKNNPYTRAQTIDLTQLKNKNIYGFVKLRSGKGTNPFIACILKTKKGEEIQKYFPLNKYLIPDKTFQSIPYYFETSQIKTEEIEEIKLFLMNQTEQPIYVQSFEAVHY